MDMRHFLSSALLTVLVTGLARGESSNQGDVRSNLERDGWRVAYGKMITEAEYAGTVGSIVASVYTENPEPFISYMKQVMEENYSKIASQLPGVALQDLTRWLDESVRSNRIITYRNLELQAGFATYERWQEWTHPSLDTSSWPPRYRNVTEKTPLPNWHQFYVRYRLVGSDPNGGIQGPGNPPWSRRITFYSVQYYANGGRDHFINQFDRVGPDAWVHTSLVAPNENLPHSIGGKFNLRVLAYGDNFVDLDDPQFNRVFRLYPDRIDAMFRDRGQWLTNYFSVGPNGRGVSWR